MKYDLVNEEWISAQNLQGEIVEISLRDLLKRAHEFKCIIDEIPTYEFSLYRLLSIIAIAAADEPDHNWLRNQLRAGKFDPDIIDSYFAKWSDRFDLFSTTHPFLQTPGMVNEPEKPLAVATPIIPSGTNALHFHRSHESEFAISPKMAARLLTTFATFMTAGGAGLSPAINGAPPWYALIVGRNLFETISLNCDLSPNEGGIGVPIWQTPFHADTREVSVPLLAGLTSQPRQIQLLPGPPGCCSISGEPSACLIRSIKFRAGSPSGLNWTDPAVAYKEDAKGKRTPLRPQADREIWRDTGPLTMLHRKDYVNSTAAVRFTRPRLLEQFSELRPWSREAKRETLRLQMYGMRTDLKNKVFECHKEQLSLPIALVWNDRYHITLQEEMEKAGSIAYELNRGIKKAYPREGAGNKDAMKNLIDYASRRYWRQLQPVYADLLQALADVGEELSAEDAATTTAPWREHLRNVAKTTFDYAIDQLDTDGEAIRRQFEARAFFRARVNALLSPKDPANKKTKAATKSKNTGGN